MNMRAWFFAQKGNKVELLLHRKRDADRDWKEIGIVEAANEDFVALEKAGRENCIPYRAIDRFRAHDE
ncbi:MAG: hypothetical protein ACYTEZ_18965 [Planctomycetota bacterium]|jgi:hypothetical protein